ncbi:hypothetical protein B0H14DRAFT_3120131 [Mycena olivaceomarginata]|nr:hypothetical protein B0H14DRAFT_3120131 [Mycena olivaceomarginata]
MQETSGIAWQVVPASQFSGGISQLQNAIVQEKTWYAVTINSGATTSLSAAVSAVDASYNSSLAITFMGSEARNENIYRIVAGQLDAITLQLTLQFLKNISSSANVGTLLSTAPELGERVTFVGLIYLLILSFFIVMVSTAAREISGLEKILPSLFYTLLSRAFQLPFDRHFGSAGLCLALEAMITLLTARFVPFFLIIFIITNVLRLCVPACSPPHIYRYGYAFPFYNISRAVRSIVFRTKNDVGMNFGILIAWVALSCITLPLFPMAKTPAQT